MEEPFRHFLFVQDKGKNRGGANRSAENRSAENRSAENRGGAKEEEEVQFESLCNYGLYPANEPMNVNDYKFKVRGNFLTRLSTLYDHIRKDGKKNRIENVHEISPKIFLRDILTEYTVKNIFRLESQNKLIHIINRIMRELYDQFYEDTNIRLYFIYRGGNILKMYKSNIEAVFPGKARKIFKEEFEPYFKNSDIDFYTVIKDSEKMTKNELFVVNSYIQMMCYYGTYVARIFVMNNFNLFEFCKFNKVSVSEDFQSLLDKMNEDKNDSEFKEIREAKFIGLGFNEYMFMEQGYDIDKILDLPQKKIIDEFIHNVDDLNVFETYKKYRKAGRFDINISPTGDYVEINKIDYNQENLFKEDFRKMMGDLVKKNKVLEYYITNNNEIYNKDEYIDFSLVRLMINFVVVYERKGKYGLTNSSSELFDLSIGHPDDKMYSVYTSDSIIPYEFKYDGDLKDEIYIPAIETTILDLINILFEYRDFPWDDVKYEKRLYRLLVLVFSLEASKKSLSEMEKILKSKSMREYKDEFDTTFETLKFRNKKLEKKNPDKSKLKEYLKRYDDILKKLLNVVDQLKNFVDTNHQIEKKDLYTFEH